MLIVLAKFEFSLKLPVLLVELICLLKPPLTFLLKSLSIPNLFLLLKSFQLFHCHLMNIFDRTIFLFQPTNCFDQVPHLFLKLIALVAVPISYPESGIFLLELVDPLSASF